jgi:FtsZ-binding cell division protein ZapB
MLFSDGKLEMDDAEDNSGCNQDQQDCKDPHEHEQSGNEFLKEQRIPWCVRLVAGGILIGHLDRHVDF